MLYICAEINCNCTYHGAYAAQTVKDKTGKTPKKVGPKYQKKKSFQTTSSKPRPATPSSRLLFAHSPSRPAGSFVHKWAVALQTFIALW